MRILFVGYVWPEPRSSAAGQNIVSYILACKNAQFDVWFCSAADQTSDKVVDLKEFGVQAFTCKLNSNSFDEQVSSIAPDIVIFDRFLSFEQYAPRVKTACPEAMLVLDAEDLHFVRHARHQIHKRKHNKDNSKTFSSKMQRAFASSQEILSPEYVDLLYNQMSIREMACIYQADLTIVLSDFEERLLTSHFNVPESQVCHLPFILNWEAAPRSKVSFAEKQDCVFIGNYRHAPNYDAVLHLRQHIWPQLYKNFVKEKLDVCCHVYGAYMPKKVKQLESKQIQFFVHGFADDQFEVIENARLMLSPINFGAGVKGKLLDAMRVDTPSVTSPIGAEGISNLPWSGAISKTNEAFIQSAFELYIDEQKWQQTVKNGQTILKNQYSVDDNSMAFIKVITNTYAKLNHFRNNNFMQKLLWHHQFQTSKYMSQWIEAKNKL